MVKNRKLSISLIALIFLSFAIVVGYNYIYQDHRNIETEQAIFSLSADEIGTEFSENFNTSEIKYLNKTIEISGIITEINITDLTLDNKIFCLLSDTLFTVKANTKIKIKGRCIGYDDLLELVKLDQCYIIN